MKYNIMIANSRLENRLHKITMDEEEVRKRLANPIRTAESQAEYLQIPRQKQADIKDVGGFVAGVSADGSRKADQMVSRCMIVYDIDKCTLEKFAEIRKQKQYKRFLYTTHKHTPDHPRFRLLYPLIKGVSAEAYVPAAIKLAQQLSILDLIDSVSLRPAQFMYFPSASRDGEYIYEEVDGAVVDADKLLACYTDWHNTAEWSQLLPVQMPAPKGKQAQDPCSKGGVIGAFCAAHSIDDAILQFIPDIYRPSTIPGRYDYTRAESHAGLIVYDGKYAYSHHASDPACCGSLLNAFDLVRVHKFGALDVACTEGTPTAKRPSCKAMLEFAVKDPSTKQILLAQNLKSAPQNNQAGGQSSAQTKGKASATDWTSLLEVDKAGHIVQNTANVCTILLHDPELKSICYNTFRDSLDVTGPLPWKQVKKGFGDADWANLRNYFAKKYEITAVQMIRDAVLGTYSSERAYHPIRDYLESLSWDGTARIDSLLENYLGAENSEYTQQTIAITLIAAVARIYKPGYLFQTVLVLSGPQGIGKSTFFAKLFSPYYSDSLSLFDLRDKTGPEKLSGLWGIELSELSGLRKMDVETIKSFVSRSDDQYRRAYGTVVESHPRSCVIVATTNNANFLRDSTGNRRFLVVPVYGGTQKHPWDLTQNDVDQIWAEAVVRYNRGDSTILTETASQVARELQTVAMEEDAREGLVDNYLSTLLPADWDKRSAEKRLMYYQNINGVMQEKGTVQRDRVSCLEIWVECLGKPRSDIKKNDSAELITILTKLGWHRVNSKTGKTNRGCYGPQITFERT